MSETYRVYARIEPGTIVEEDCMGRASLAGLLHGIYRRLVDSDRTEVVVLTIERAGAPCAKAGADAT